MVSLNLFISAARGLEPMLVEELTALGLEDVKEGRGGVSAKGDLAAAYRACLWSRLASRVLLVLDRAPLDTPDELYTWIRGIRWEDHIPVPGSMAVDCVGIGVGIDNTQFGAMKVKDAVVDRLRAKVGDRPNVAKERPDVRLHCHLTERGAQISIDLSGEPLHRRGYRREETGAPLKESLAAAMLYRAGWPDMPPGTPLVDPMCGSGTLLIEAAWIAGDHAPGLNRTYFGFSGWLGHQADTWKALIDEAIQRWEDGQANIGKLTGYDIDPKAIRTTLANAGHADLTDRIHAERRPISQATAPAGQAGLVITNPPYGERLGEIHQLQILYGQLGFRLKRQFPGWRAAVLAGSDEQLRDLGLRADRRYTLFNGALRCRLGVFSVSQDSHEAPLPAIDLANRIQKNLKHLRKWVQREAIDCYRIYDADLPEYALAIDIYQGEERRMLHVQEYEAPKTVDADKAARRLHDALLAIPDAVGIPPEDMRLKTRRKQSGKQQYERVDDTGTDFIVREGKARLWVNLDDYLDTGLFLDHRTVRLWLAENSQGKRLLNLFSYTSAATVHAALGGAKDSLSLDLSKTYLSWSERNFKLNRLNPKQHRLERADCLDWLQYQANSDRRLQFDLIFFDPPTFSTSKAMKGTLDIQRDHAGLVRQAMALLAPGGTLVFSTNARKFKLDAGLEDDFAVEDVTRWSIPEDFGRNQRIHRCFFVRFGE